MFKTKRRIMALLSTVLLIIGMLGTTVFAAKSSNDAMIKLRGVVTSGKYTYQANGGTTGEIIDYTGTQDYKTYKTSGGGYYLYTELFSTNANSSTNCNLIDSGKFEELTGSAKQKFLKDVLYIANCYEADCTNGKSVDGVTTETVNAMVQNIQDTTGMGSALMASILQNTKPDFVTANKIYEPFSGVIGTVLGLISILLMALLGVTMALDIAYIVVPAFQMLLDGDADSQNGTTKGMARIVSVAARKAVKAAEEQGGGGGQSGSGNKMALGVYFKYRWKELLVLGVCLLYLVQGQIYSFVAWVLDLMSGFLGF